MQVSNDELMGTEMRLKSINSLAQVVKAQRADVKADYVLGIGGFNLDRVADEVRVLSTRIFSNRYTSWLVLLESHMQESGSPLRLHLHCARASCQEAHARAMTGN